MNVKGFALLLPVVLLTLVMLISVIFLPGFFEPKADRAAENAQEEFTEPIVYQDSTAESYNIGINSYPRSLEAGERFTISWEFDNYITNFTENVYFCLTGLSESKEIIDTLEEGEVCMYAYYGEHSAWELGSTLIAERSFSVAIPKEISGKYESKPAYYVVKMIAVDERADSHEWAGTVGFAETGSVELTGY